MDKRKKKNKKTEINDPGDEINNSEKEKGGTQFDESYPFDNSEPNHINENHNLNDDKQKHANIKNTSEKKSKNTINSFENDIHEFLPQHVDNNSDIFHINKVNKIEENNINNNEQNRDPNDRPDPKGNDESDFEKNDKNNNLLVTNENVNNHFENSDGNSNQQLNKNDDIDEYNEHSNKSEDTDEDRSGRKKRSVKDNVYEDFIREYKNLQSLFSYNKTIMNESFDPMPSISEDDNNNSDKNDNEHNEDIKTPFDENVNKSATSCNHANPDYSATYNLNNDAAAISDANKTREKTNEQAREQAREKKVDETNNHHASNQLNYPTNNDAKENENKSLLSEKENENDKEKTVEAKNNDTHFGEDKEHMELKKEIKHKESENQENKQNKQNKQNKEKEINDNVPENEENIIWKKEKDIDETSKKKDDHYIQKKNTITLQPQEINSSSNISVASIINDNLNDYNLYKKNIAKMDIDQIPNDLKKKTHHSIDNNEHKNNRISAEIQKSKSETNNIKIKKVEKEMDNQNFYINILDENGKDNSKKDLYLNNSFYSSKRDNNNNAKVKSAKHVDEINPKIKKVSKHQVTSDEGSEIDEIGHDNYSKHRKKDIKKKKMEKKNNNTENTFDSKYLNDDNISLSYFTEDKKEDYDSNHETKETSHEYGKVKKHIREHKETNKYKTVNPTIVNKIKNINKHTDFNINSLDNQLCKLDSPIKRDKHHKETTKKKSIQTSSSVKKKHTKHSSKRNKREDDGNNSDMKEWESKFLEEDEEDDEEDNDPYLAIINEKKKKKKVNIQRKKKYIQ